MKGFYEQVQRNTRYVVHPEEILADNFRWLVLSQMDPGIAQSLSVEGVRLLQAMAAIKRR